MILRWSDRAWLGWKKLHFQKFCSETMLIFFFNCKGMVYRELVPQCVTINRQYYRGILNWLLKYVACVWPTRFCDHDFFILRDNASAHTTGINQCLLASRQAPMIAILCIPHIWVHWTTLHSQKWYYNWKGDCFDSIEDIQTAVTIKLKAISPREVSKAMRDLDTYSWKMLSRLWLGYDNLENNMVFLNLVIDAMGRLWTLSYFNNVINLAQITYVTTVTEESLLMVMRSYQLAGWTSGVRGITVIICCTL